MGCGNQINLDYGNNISLNLSPSWAFSYLLNYGMCGRYAFTPGSDFFDHFSLLDPDYERGSLQDNHNVSPGQLMPVITKGQKFNQLSLMRWGMVPSWAKDSKIGFKMINARAESISIKPSFKIPFRRHRCLIPANGYYEWKKEDKKKIPFYYTLKNQPLFAFAGLFDHWLSPDGVELQSYTIITTVSNDLAKAVHDRMPVILKSEDEKVWLDETSKEESLISLLKPYPSQFMSSVEVS
jgi:putative SOS response-associated peptidase YedK